METKKIYTPNGITFGMFVVIMLAMSIVLILTLIKIYLSNQIYHESKIVNGIKNEVAILKAEHAVLKQNLETIKFKTQVLDTIFVIEN